MATAASSKAPAPPHTGATGLSPLGEVMVLRYAVSGGATRAELARDLRAMVAPDQAPAAWRRATDGEVAGLLRLRLVEETKGRIKTTEAGSAHAASWLGAPLAVRATWQDVREGPLTAKALSLDPASKAVVKALANADNLRGYIVQRAYGLIDGKAVSLAKLRAGLAVRALERAFGNQIKSGFGSGDGLAAKPSRMLAGQLLKTPRDCGTDGRLIATLAAEHLGTRNAEAETLRAALLRRDYIARLEAFDAPVKTRSAAAAPQQVAAAPPAQTQTVQALLQPEAKPVVANDAGRAGERPLPAGRPDLKGFIKHVQAAAARRAEGWPGNRKAFISHVWQEIKSVHASWALSEIEFKGMLAEAHRTGGLVLANADLKDKKHIQEFENSAIQYKNTVWHFVRVDEA